MLFLTVFFCRYVCCRWVYLILARGVQCLLLTDSQNARHLTDGLCQSACLFVSSDLLSSRLLFFFVVFQAAKAGSLSYVKALLLQGQDPNQTDYSGQYTPLIAATFLAHIQV